MVLMNKKQVLKESEDFFFTLTTYGYNFKMAGSFLPFDLEEIWNQFSKYLFLKDSESEWAF